MIILLIKVGDSHNLRLYGNLRLRCLTSIYDGLSPDLSTISMEIWHAIPLLDSLLDFESIHVVNDRFRHRTLPSSRVMVFRGCLFDEKFVAGNILPVANCSSSCVGCCVT